MSLDVGALRDLLCARLCEDVQVDERPDGGLMVRTHFRFPDGDGFPLHLSAAPSGGLRLSDHGHTLMHISYEHDIDSFLAGTRGMLLERTATDSSSSPSSSSRTRPRSPGSIWRDSPMSRET
ncbi:MAG: DUF1828 domain-containing protein [bacterium]|nr:DUF1828 domain-containing protein [bacterium]